MSGWTIAMGDWPHFDIEPASPNARSPHSDESLNGVHPTRLDAIEQVVADFEATRRALGEQIARAKRMRRAELARLSPTPIEEA